MPKTALKIKSKAKTAAKTKPVAKTKSKSSSKAKVKAKPALKSKTRLEVKPSTRKEIAELIKKEQERKGKRSKLISEAKAKTKVRKPISKFTVVI